LDVEGILEGQQRMRIKNLLEGLNAQQRSIPQLPAQARAKHISVLGAKTDPKHPFAGYMVGADESAEPSKKRLGPDENDPYEKGWRAGFRQNEFNPYQKGSKEAEQWDNGYDEARSQPDHYDESVAEGQLDEKCWDGYKKQGMKTMFGKRVPNCIKNEAAERNELDDPRVQAALKKMAERHKDEKWSKEQLAALGKRIAARGQKSVKEGDIIKTPTGLIHRAKDKYGAGEEPFNPHNPGKYAMDLTSVNKQLVKDLDASMGITYKKQGPKGLKVDEAVTKEDIISKLKAKLGDYLSDISKEIKKDPDLVDKLAAKAPGDQMGPPVKTITTDDGHQIQIHGNEDDGFRISIKNKPAATRFKNLDEAVMACEMYCAQRRKQTESADYVEEAGKDACYHKVKSRYKIWPSAYASGALVQCRKKGADNWGDKSKK
jgi:hypothetical protein